MGLGSCAIDNHAQVACGKVSMFKVLMLHDLGEA
jgi:hypothetical protein